MIRMEEKRTNGGLIWATSIFLIATPLLYVLSIGPIEAHFQNTDAPEWVVSFYSPLAWAVNQSAACKEWFLWYINLWK
jgi:hypothetical protein